MKDYSYGEWLLTQFNASDSQSQKEVFAVTGLKTLIELEKENKRISSELMKYDINIDLLIYLRKQGLEDGLIIRRLNALADECSLRKYHPRHESSSLGTNNDRVD